MLLSVLSIVIISKVVVSKGIISIVVVPFWGPQFKTWLIKLVWLSGCHYLLFHTGPMFASIARIQLSGSHLLAFLA
jgi:hypothetical protein